MNATRQADGISVHEGEGRRRGDVRVEAAD